MKENVSLKELNTFGIDVKAKILQKFTTADQLKNLLDCVSEPLLILGGGSNILFTKDFEGTVLKNEILGTELVYEDEKKVVLKVGAGVNWHDFVLYCVRKNWSGTENLSLIPGTVGAAPIQNIGAYGVEVKDIIVQVDFFDKSTKSIKTLKNKDCLFGYRDSIFKTTLKDQFVITHVHFELQKEGNLNTNYGAIVETLESKGIIEPTVKDISEAVINIRSSKLPNPKELGNAGSFFKNPIVSTEVYNDLLKRYPDMPSYPISERLVKIPAGWLIQKSGWKGNKLGNVGVHKHQALVLVNYGGGTGQEIMNLALEIKKSVIKYFGIEIEAEVNII